MADDVAVTMLEAAVHHRDPVMLGAVLALRGWDRIQTRWGDILVYRHGDSEVIIPADRALFDYDVALDRAVAQVRVAVIGDVTPIHACATHLYHGLLQRVLESGAARSDRTGTGTLSLFGEQLRFDLGAGFPLVTTKKVHIPSVVHELLWFLRGESNVGYLRENRVTIWDEWADEQGELGPIYGVQWRKWPGHDGTIDQVRTVIDQLRRNPDSRRLVVSAWNVAELERMALQPCHALFQLYVAEGRLSCQLYQRSADVFLGVPFNIASYALLTHMIAQVCDLAVGDFVHTFGDVHLYQNHVEQARLQLSREPLPPPRLVLDSSVRDIDDFRFEHIRFEGYQHHSAIKAPVAV